jgi:hypothetical protein
MPCYESTSDYIKNHSLKSAQIKKISCLRLILIYNLNLKSPFKRGLNGLFSNERKTKIVARKSSIIFESLDILKAHSVSSVSTKTKILRQVPLT